MKHTPFHRLGRILFLIATASATLTGCTEKGDGQVFTVKTTNYNNTAKDYVAASGNDFKVHWANGDEMNINGNTYALSVNADAQTATVTANDVMAINGYYYAGFPASLCTVNGNTVSLSLPESTHYKTIESGPGAGSQQIDNLMVAATNGTTLTFRNLCSMLRFPVTGTNISLVGIEIAADQPIFGTLRTLYSGDNWNTSTSAFNSSDTCRQLLFDTPIALTSSAQDFYMLIPSVTVGTFRLRYFIQLPTGELKVFQRTKNSSVTFSAANLYNFEQVDFSSNGTPANYTNVSLGSQANPYLIMTGANWNYIMGQNATNQNKYYQLRNDIQVSATTATFKGKLDGKGHSITLTAAVPLFNALDGANVSNLSLKANSNFVNPTPYSYNSNTHFGTLACYCTNTASTIINCSNHVNISLNGVRYVGGLCGRALNCAFNGCSNYGNISSNSPDMGGIVAACSASSSISNCNNNGEIKLTAQTNATNIGGIVGNMVSSVSGCSNSGTVCINASSLTYSANIGGIAGTASGITSCDNTGDVYSSATAASQTIYLGGIGGNLASGCTILNCSSNADINYGHSTQKVYAGGIVGNVQTNCMIYNCYTIGRWAGMRSAGIAGNSNNTSTFTNCYSFYVGDLPANSSFVNGIVSVPTASTTISYCYYRTGMACTYDDATYTNSYCAEISDSNPLHLTDASSLKEALNTQALPQSNWKRWKESTYVVFDE